MLHAGHLVRHHVSISWRIAPICISLMMHRSFAWIALTAILAESSAVVLELYSIFDIIIRSFRTVADILLLVTVLLSIGAYMTNAGAGGPSSSFKPMAKKLALCGPILGIFWLVVLALQLALLVQIVEGKENNLLDVFNALLKIHFVYDLLYLIVVFGICCWTLVLSRSARGSTGPRAKVRGSPIKKVH